MDLICPECKNNVDLSRYPNVAASHVVECNMCGITLLISNVEGNKLGAEVIDEGK